MRDCRCPEISDSEEVDWEHHRDEDDGETDEALQGRVEKHGGEEHAAQGDETHGEGIGRHLSLQHFKLKLQLEHCRRQVEVEVATSGGHVEVEVEVREMARHLKKEKKRKED